MDLKLKNKWILWFHNKKNIWSINGYEKLLEINYLEEYFYLINNFDKLGGLVNNHYFIMKNNILPIWEDKNNINGGCISIKTEINDTENIWNKISLNIISEKITNYENINGISICIKNPNYCIIQIWLNKKDNKIIEFLSKNLNIENFLYKNYYNN